MIVHAARRSQFAALQSPDRGRLLRIGVQLQEGDLVYATIHEHAEGGSLLELTPDASGGWHVEDLWSHQV